MELRQLRYFKAIADAGSFVRGAQDLRVAQPALSRSIAKLEEEVESNLFVRHSSGVSLTDAGVRFYEHATEVLGSVRHLLEGMAAEDGVPRGVVTLGAPHSIQSKLVLPAVAGFLSQFPLCRLNLLQNSSPRLRKQVLEGSLDMAILPNVTESGMRITPLLVESICLICRKEDRAAFGDNIDVDDLLELPLILTGFPETLRLYIDRKFPHRSDDLNVRSEVNSSSMLVDLVVRKVGYGIAPCSVVAQRPEGELAFVPIKGLDVSWTIATNWSRCGLKAVEELEALIIRLVHDLVSKGDWPTAVLDSKASGGASLPL
ncbi:LysR family transcriptional regulator [Kordiimonas pumila]|uniref:LysR family transcriptional regulator n=1 Tax=Kordiimonas pumila TaxID=2161677 RepID=A0ABV7D6U2_9PROT|nr:LysR family transcriptional regulator [Kordiimonas pumila]